METSTLDQLRYPAGKFAFDKVADEKQIQIWIAEIESLPVRLRAAVKGLNDSQLNTPYRDGGWTLKQVVHHLADSHMNAYIRIKLALTENNPNIKPYEEKLWVEMDDAKNLPIDVSLSILEPLHARWLHMLKRIKGSEFDRTVFHPESKREMSVKFLIALYAWHSRHHLAHITELKRRSNW